MEKYKNLDKNSNVIEYRISDDKIEIVFGQKSEGRMHYVYTYKITGKETVDKMKKLAKSGRGLGSFLATKPYHNYAEKFLEQ